jgi:TIR domain
MTLFLSYSHENKVAMNEIYHLLSKNTHCTIYKDTTYTTYKSDFREYMKKVNESDYVLTLISHDFLISKNCMHEVCLTLKENEYPEIAFKKILPVLLEGTSINTLSHALNYERHWHRVYIEAIDMLKEAIPNEDLLEELRIIQNIYRKISKFILLLQKTDYAYWSSDKQRNQTEFNRILSYIT